MTDLSNVQFSCPCGCVRVSTNKPPTVGLVCHCQYCRSIQTSVTSMRTEKTPGIDKAWKAEPWLGNRVMYWPLQDLQFRVKRGNKDALVHMHNTEVPMKVSGPVSRFYCNECKTPVAGWKTDHDVVSLHFNHLLLDNREKWVASLPSHIVKDCPHLQCAGVSEGADGDKERALLAELPEERKLHTERLTLTIKKRFYMIIFRAKLLRALRALRNLFQLWRLFSPMRFGRRACPQKQKYVARDTSMGLEYRITSGKSASRGGESEYAPIELHEIPPIKPIYLNSLSGYFAPAE